MSIVIVGGGMIGLVLTLMLSKLTKGNLKISLIEQYPLCFSNFSSFLKNPKVIALSRRSYVELLKLDIYSILSIYSTVISQIEISEYSKFNKVFIRSQDYQLSELGYVIELNPIKEKLFNIVCEQPNVTMYCPATIKCIQYEQLHNVVLLDNGEYIVAKLIIVTDRSYLQFLTNCKIQWFEYNYYQTAVVSEVTTEIPNLGQAFEIFTSFGSLAFLPMHNNLSLLIWCVSSQKQKEMSQWNTDRFIQELQNIFEWKLGKILNVGPRYFYDLWLIYAKEHISYRLVLVGNAAQSLHPIAGQGFNLGMRDIITLSNIIYQTLYNNNDIGDYSVLNLYQKSRRLDQYKTIIMTDSLIRLFKSRFLPVIIARNMGLFCVENSVFLKRFFINQFLY